MVQEVFKGDKSLEDKEHSGWPSEVDNEDYWIWSSYEKFPKNSMLSLLWLFSIWSKLERWKISISGYFMSWLKILKNHFEVSSSLILSMQWGRIISPSDYDVRWKGDFIRQLVTTSSVVGLRRSSKALPKAKLAPKKMSCHCLVICCLSDTLQLSES